MILKSNLKVKFASSLTYLILLFCTYHASAQDPLRWEETIRKYEKRDSLNPAEEGANLFVGSSSIAMWQDVADYFPESYVLNRGFGGSHFSDLIHYADRIIYPYKPATIFIYEGDNDIAAGEKISDIINEARQLREMIHKNLPGVKVIFISPKPSVARWELEKQYIKLNKKLKQYADKTPDTEFADVWYPALDENGEVFKDIFLEDNLHMNAKGYKIWQKVLAPHLTNDEVE